ncbi:MAG TPA: peptide MFS transporter [Kofleriaceae bacterium]|nr:peptide MFS transporter [Kofleriaceae bacterium]
MSNVAAAKSANGNGGKTFFGHPKGLQTLFFTEMWERFSYYGMRAFLVVYVSTSTALGGLGQSKATAGIVYALYGSSIYLMSLPGGFIADRYIGQRMAVLIGGVIIMCGHIALAVPGDVAFITGLVLLVLGTGMLKPNVSTIVGQLYAKNDVRRDAGYTIYYMGINIGALLAPIICGQLLAESQDLRAFLKDNGISPNAAWHFGFGAAAVGMFAGIVQFVYGWKYLGDAGAAPKKLAKGEREPVPSAVGIIMAISAAIIGLFIWWRVDYGGEGKKILADCFGVGLIIVSGATFVTLHNFIARDHDEKRRVRAMMVLFLGCLSFFGLFEQAGSTLSLFAEEKVHRELLGFNVTQSFYQTLNAGYVILIAPVFALLWIALAKKGKEPTSVTKFSIGMVITALSFATLLPALLGPIADGGKVTGLYLFIFYLVSTLAELCISPVGLSTMNKLAPDRLAGFVMGIWFLATAVGYYIAGRAEHEVGSLAKHLDLHPTAGLFYLLILFALMIALILYLLAGPVKRMLAHEPPTDLPKAKVVAGGTGGDPST